MRYGFRIGFAVALGLALMAGCSDENGQGGSGGTAGTGAMAGEGGTGGMPECQGAEDCDDDDKCSLDTCEDGVCKHMPVEDYYTYCADDSGICIDGSCRLVSCEGIANGVACINCGIGGCLYGVCFDGACDGCAADAECNDYNECTTESCLSAGICEWVAVQDGVPCAGGTCDAAECALQGTVLPCTEQGIRNAIASGGGPYTFDCDGPKMVMTEAEIVIDNDVILDGEGNLMVDGNGDHPVFSVPIGVIAELRGFAVSGGLDTGVFNQGQLTISNSTISRNLGTAINNWVQGTLTLVGTTVSNNTASSGGGGISNGGILTLTNSTVSTNTSLGTSGIFSHAGTTRLLNSTVVGNVGNYTFGRTTLTNSSVSGECVGEASESFGHNIESPGDTCGFDQPTDQVNISGDDLKLGPLQDNGGPTMSHALGAGSVAIDQISAEDCVDAEGAPLTTDQRGEPRPVAILGAEPKCDVGAFEVQP